MNKDHDLVEMFLAGVEWERKQGDKPRERDAINFAIARIRDAAEHYVELSQSGPTVSKEDTSNDNCPICDGLGEIHWSDGSISRCFSCNGTGSYTD